MKTEKKLILSKELTEYNANPPFQIKVAHIQKVKLIFGLCVKLKIIVKIMNSTTNERQTQITHSNTEQLLPLH